MEYEAKSTAQPGHKPLPPGVLRYPFLIRVVFVILFFFLVLLLGVSMTHYRFFRGGRVHPNGSIGQ